MADMAVFASVLGIPVSRPAPPTLVNLAESGNLEEIKRLTEGGENVNHTIGFELSGR